jgi:leader peptidase (prepilin peptidase) / N-methyltransferase
MPESDALADTAAFLWPATALALGLIVGSFANVCIHRIPLGESVVAPRSRCPSCRAPIAALDNVPVLSFLVLGGRCRHCAARISWRYPAVEAANGLLYLGVALRDGLSPQVLVDMVLITTLLVLSLIDLDHQILPNVITRPGIAVGVAANLLLHGWRVALECALAAAAGYLAFAAVALAYQRTRGVEGLGQGDWKLAALLGAFLGWKRMLLTVFLASLAGTVVGVLLMLAGGRDARHRLPLGTFLGAAGIAVVFVGDDLVRWYQGLLPP